MRGLTKKIQNKKFESNKNRSSLKQELDKIFEEEDEMKTKIAVIAGKQHRLFSYDGKTWATSLLRLKLIRPNGSKPVDGK